MKFTPKTEEQIAAEGLIAANTVCDFECVEAEEKTSKAGNPMMALKHKVWRPDGSTTLMFDWLLTDQAWKLRAFAEGAGLLAKYEAGVFEPDDIIGATGKLKVGVDPAKDGYPARNKVLGYEKAGGGTAPRGAGAGAKPRAVPAGLDDDIPFAPECR